MCSSICVGQGPTLLFDISYNAKENHTNVCHWMSHRFLDENSVLCFVSSATYSIRGCDWKFDYWTWEKISRNELPIFWSCVRHFVTTFEKHQSRVQFYNVYLGNQLTQRYVSQFWLLESVLWRIHFMEMVLCVVGFVLTCIYQVFVNPLSPWISYTFPVPLGYHIPLLRLMGTEERMLGWYWKSSLASYYCCWLTLQSWQ